MTHDHNNSTADRTLSWVEYGGYSLQLSELVLRLGNSFGKSTLVRVLLLTVLVVSSFLPTASAQWYVRSAAYRSTPFMSCEHLRFKVKWEFIRLGSVEFTQERDSGNDPKMYDLSSEARSAAGLPFVDVNLSNSAVVKSDCPKNIDFRFIDRSSSKSEAFYSYNEATHTAFMKGIDDGKDTVTTSVYSADGCYDPLGFLMLLRCLSGCGYDTVVKLMIANQLRDTHLFFSPKVEPVRIDMFKTPVLAHRFELRADWKDPHSGGLNGNITGWISADSEAVPLLFKIKILVGSVTVELESCSRPGWTPPTASLASGGRSAGSEDGQ